MLFLGSIQIAFVLIHAEDYARCDILLYEAKELWSLERHESKRLCLPLHLHQAAHKMYGNWNAAHKQSTMSQPGCGPYPA